jgi:hypothetical protein
MISQLDPNTSAEIWVNATVIVMIWPMIAIMSNAKWRRHIEDHVYVAFIFVRLFLFTLLGHVGHGCFPCFPTCALFYSYLPRCVTSFYNFKSCVLST